MKDGSDAVCDWPMLNALLNTAGGATWVSLHHGGGVGMGYSQHAGVVIVCDGSDAAAKRIERVLWNDPATGVMRHADAGYEIASGVRARAGARSCRCWTADIDGPLGRTAPAEIDLHYLNHADVEALALTDDEILRAVEQASSRRAAARRRSSRACTWCPRRTGRATSTCCAATSARSHLAGVKVVGDFYRNYERGLPSELALLNLFDPTHRRARRRSSTRRDITDMRTGAVTAIGARELARAGFEGARPHRRARHGVLERAAARLDLRSSTKSASIRAGRKAATRSPRGSRRPAARRSSSPTTGSRACAAPTSSSRRPASRSPRRC